MLRGTQYVCSLIILCGSIYPCERVVWPMEIETELSNANKSFADHRSTMLKPKKKESLRVRCIYPYERVV
jgi:hypothetical protein